MRRLLNASKENGHTRKTVTLKLVRGNSPTALMWKSLISEVVTLENWNTASVGKFILFHRNGRRLRKIVGLLVTPVQLFVNTNGKSANQMEQLDAFRHVNKRGKDNLQKFPSSVRVGKKGEFGCWCQTGWSKYFRNF